MDSDDPSIFLLGFINQLLIDKAWLLFSLFGVLILLLGSAMVSGLEVAYSIFTPNELNELKENNDKKDQTILGFLKSYKQLLATILIANNFINIALVVLSTYITSEIIPDQITENQAFVIQVVMVTFLLLLFGEVAPKIYAKRNPLKLARLLVYPLRFLMTIFHYLSKVLVSSTDFVERMFNVEKDEISVSDLSTALELTKNHQSIEKEEEKILEGIVKFGNTDVKQIMKSRVDVISVNVSDDFQYLMNLIRVEGHSRIPVYQDSFDKVLGILYIKDLLPHIGKRNYKWQKLVRAPFFVPETKMIDDLLKEFQQKRIHLAIVVDEYGGTSGIVTLEDVMEEVVGDISDEFDVRDISYSKINDSTYVFEGKTLLNDLYRVLDIEGEEFEKAKGDADTLAGLILELAGKIPQKNEKIPFADYTFVIEASDKRKVKQVKVICNDKGQEE